MSNPPGPRIVLLGGPRETTRFVYHALAARFDVVQAIVEQAPARAGFLKRRAERLGWFTVGGQVLFRSLAVPLLTRGARRRRDSLKSSYQLDDRAIPDDVRLDVSSVNDPVVQERLAALDPEVVVVNGTRIIGKATLAACDAPFINIHTGITPKYRGVHGGYWALAEGDPTHCGVTVHLVDAGIDTGGVLGQARIEPGPKDNFTTYVLHQYGVGVPLLLDVLARAADGLADPVAPLSRDSRLWSHPTVWGYLARRLAGGAK